MLHVWCQSDKSERCLRVFDWHNIHGIRHAAEQPDRVIVFGDKAFAVVCMGRAGFAVTHRDRLDDLVLDCLLVRQDDSDLMVVAYAHNMIDVRNIASPHESLLLHRCHCPAGSVLFAASLDRLVDGQIRIATGSVFGHLYFWQCPLLSTGSASGTMLAQCRAHEGVIFRITWNGAGSKMLTVSDDRTTRLWKIERAGDGYALQEVLVGWGHVCRVWDAAFTSESEDEVATSSEDGTVRLWNLGGQCIAVLCGHIDSVWRVLSVGGRYLVSAGNDSTIKFWDLAHHRLCSPAHEGLSAQLVAIPTSTTSLQTLCEEGNGNAHGNRRRNGINTIRFSPCGTIIILLLIDGITWAINATGSSSAEGFQWTQLVQLRGTVSAGDACITANGDGSFAILIAASFLDGGCTLLRIHLVCSESGCMLRECVCSDWKPHEYKSVNIWIIYDIMNSPAVCSATMKGECSVWRVGDTEMCKLWDFSTEKQQIACSVLHKVVNGDCFFIVGDARGGISIFSVVADTKQADSFQYFHRSHGTDPVSCIVSSHSTGFITAGHDGSICFFDVQMQGSCGGWLWQLTNSMSTLPISTPDQIFLPISTTTSANAIPSKSIIVAGYHGSSLIVYDVLLGYQLMRVEGGGWKRPHRCNINYYPLALGEGCNNTPDLLFVCPVPVGKDETHLQVNGRVRGIAAHRSSSSQKSEGQLQLNSSCFGRVSYCSVIITAPQLDQDILVVGGEDCTIKVFDLSSLQLLQETTLSKNSSLKSLHATANILAGIEGAKQGIVLGGGGKLLYYVWSYDFSDGVAAIPLRRVAVGYVWPRATQDHRILSVRCNHVGVVGDAHQYALFLCDSRGIMTILSLLHNFSCIDSGNHTIVSSLHEIEVSSCPLLCCSTLFLNFQCASGPVIVCCVGDTKGSVHTIVVSAFSQSSRFASIHNVVFVITFP